MMVDATLSRVRMRDLIGLGRCRPCASPRRTGTDGDAIAAGTPRRPRATSSRPGADDFVASTI
jgi:hypothetical protein